MIYNSLAEDNHKDGNYLLGYRLVMFELENCLD